MAHPSRMQWKLLPIFHILHSWLLIQPSSIHEGSLYKRTHPTAAHNSHTAGIRTTSVPDSQWMAKRNSTAHTWLSMLPLYKYWQNGGCTISHSVQGTANIRSAIAGVWLCSQWHWRLSTAFVIFAKKSSTEYSAILHVKTMGTMVESKAPYYWRKCVNLKKKNTIK